MARDFNHQGLGWARASCVCAALVALLIGGCARDFAPKPPAVGPWAYEFQLGNFKDARPQNDDAMLMSEPFTTNGFMQGWRNSVGRTVFGNIPAWLDVTLNQYETTSNARSYAMNMDVSLRARDRENRILGVMNGKCDAIVRTDMKSLWDFGQQASAQGTLKPLTAEARNATMWQKVMDSCVAELAKQFDTTLAAGVH